MKKKQLCALLAAAPLILLCGCRSSVPSLALSANWYSYTTGKEIVETDEELKYNVTFEGRERDGYRVDYSNGKYVTTLKNGIETLDGKSVAVYIYTAELNIDVKFTYNGTESETFSDRTFATVKFLGVQDGLQPISSEKEIEEHVPVSVPSETEFFKEYHYSYSFAYDNPLSSAVYTYTDLTAETPEPTESKIKLGGSGTYLDNEQIFFALRGLSLNATVSFRSVDPQTKQCVTLTFPSAPTAVDKEMCEFTVLNAQGETEEEVNREIATRHVSLSYRAAQPGATRGLIYAATTNENANEFRNVLIQLSNDIMQSMGTLTYTLDTARFSA